MSGGGACPGMKQPSWKGSERLLVQPTQSSKWELRPRVVDSHLPRAAPQVGGRAGTRVQLCRCPGQSSPQPTLSPSFLTACLPSGPGVRPDGTGQPGNICSKLECGARCGEFEPSRCCAVFLINSLSAQPAEGTAAFSLSRLALCLYPGGQPSLGSLN